jgi:hypothetical protein
MVTIKKLSDALDKAAARGTSAVAGTKYPRREVYAVIDAERDYQDQRHPGHEHSVLEFLAMIREYAHEGMVEAMHHKDARKRLKQIAALAVACLEENGFLADFGPRS